MYVLDAVLLAVPVSLVLIRLYRRAVERAMHAASAASEAAALPAAPSPAREPRNIAQIRRRERLERSRAVLVYTVAGASAAAVWTWLTFHEPGLEFKPLRAFAVWYGYCWPVPATLIAILAIPRRRSLWLIAGYVAVGAVVIAAWSAALSAVSGGPTHVLGNLQSFLSFLVLEASLPGFIIWIASSRRIRGVLPLAMAGLLVFTFSSVAVRAAFVALLDVGGLRNLLLGIGPNWWFMLATVPVGYVCWLWLRLLNAAYRRKAFSDVQLVADSFWLIVAFMFSASYAGSFGWKAIAGLGGFAAYRVVVQLGLALGGRRCLDPGMRLLILRVFGFRGRSEKLFDTVAQRWRFRGGVAMIAGTDLAARTIDPDDTLTFLAGEMGSRFVRGALDLRERLGTIDERRDPDGRFRIAEFFCHENTWTGTLEALLSRSDAILMDLRGFSDKNSGCVFELRQLAFQGRLGDTVFVVDADTDIGMLRATVGAAPPRLEKIGAGTAGERERVYRSLCGAGGTISTPAVVQEGP